MIFNDDSPSLKLRRNPSEALAKVETTVRMLSRLKMTEKSEEMGRLIEIEKNMPLTSAKSS